MGQLVPGKACGAQAHHPFENASETLKHGQLVPGSACDAKLACSYRSSKTWTQHTTAYKDFKAV